MVMQLRMEALEQWNVVEAVSKNRAKDRWALSMIIHMKKLAEEAWDAVKKMHANDDHMKAGGGYRRWQ